MKKGWIVFACMVIVCCVSQNVWAQEVILEITDCEGKAIEVTPEKDIGIAFNWGEGMIIALWQDISLVEFPCSKTKLETVEDIASFFSKQPIEVTYTNGEKKKINYKWFAGSNNYNFSGRTDMGIFIIHSTRIKQIAVKSTKK